MPVPRLGPRVAGGTPGAPGITGRIATMDCRRLRPGDLAVTEGGAHVMVFLSGERWIPAHPGLGRVATLNGRKDKTSWFQHPVGMHRWTVVPVIPARRPNGLFPLPPGLWNRGAWEWVCRAGNAPRGQVTRAGPGSRRGLPPVRRARLRRVGRVRLRPAD